MTENLLEYIIVTSFSDSIDTEGVFTSAFLVYFNQNLILMRRESGLFGEVQMNSDVDQNNKQKRRPPQKQEADYTVLYFVTPIEFNLPDYQVWKQPIPNVIGLIFELVSLLAFCLFFFLISCCTRATGQRKFQM